MSQFAVWVGEFKARAHQRTNAGDPPWAQGAQMHPALVRSVQRFQVGESGDGANLIAKAEADGPTDYATAARLFVAEERHHAHLLAALLAAADAPTIQSHWSDTLFVRLRRALGLRLELMVLMIAEVVALRYYRALRDGTDDPAVSAVAGQILTDEQRHVPFHCDRLRIGFASMPPVARHAVATAWRALFVSASLVVAVDHGPALRQLGVTRRRFIVDVFGLFNTAVASAFAAPTEPFPVEVAQPAVRMVP